MNFYFGEPEERKHHFKFFGRFFLNITVVALLAPIVYYACVLIGMYVLRISLLQAILGFITFTLITAGLIFWRFSSLGYEEKKEDRVGFIPFIAGSLPAWLIYTAVHSMLIFFCGFYINAMCALSVVLIGRGKGYFMSFEEVPEGFYEKLVPSFAVNIILYTALAFISYKIGIRYREFSREQTLCGGDAEARIHKKIPIVKCFIPFLNVTVIFWWFVFYLIDPTKKLRRLAKLLILMLLIFGALYLLYFAVANIFSSKWVVIPTYWLFLYVSSTLLALIAYKDEKRYSV